MNNFSENDYQEFKEFQEWKKKKEAMESKAAPPPVIPPSDRTDSTRKANREGCIKGCLIVAAIVFGFIFLLALMGTCGSDSDKKREASSGNIPDPPAELMSTEKPSYTETSIDKDPELKKIRIEELKHTIKIKSAYLSQPNSVGGVDAHFYYKNTSDKTIKYLTWTGLAYNAVGDSVSCEIRRRYYFNGQDTGPIRPGKSGGGVWECPWYNWSAKKLKIVEIEIEYTDGIITRIRPEEMKYVK